MLRTLAALAVLLAGCGSSFEVVVVDVDGGVDADDADVQPDAGAPDAGPPDPDAGLPDGGVDVGTEDADAGPASLTPNDATQAANPGWIAGLCDDDDDCAFDGGFCLFDRVPYGVCARDCARTCPDSTGETVTGTFCVDGRPFGRDEGVCVSTCDVDVYGASGCPTGYACQPRNRYSEPATLREACLPVNTHSSCEESDDVVVDLLYPDEGSLWIPHEALCGGAFDLVVMMHGLNAEHRVAPSLAGGRHLEHLVRDLIDVGTLRPVLLAEPVHFQASSVDLYGEGYDPAEHLQLLSDLLDARGITLSSLSFIGHSGAGCADGNGLYKVLDDVDVLVPAFAPAFRLWGMEDNCYGAAYHWEEPAAVLGGAGVVLVNMTTSGGDPTEFEAGLPVDEDFACDDAVYLSCLRHQSEDWCSYQTDTSAGTTHDNNPYFFVRQVFPDVFGVDDDVAACGR